MRDPAQWCHSTLDAYRPVFDNLAAALAQRPASDVSPDPAADPMSSMMNGLMSAMAPMMLGMTVGSMVGQLAARAFGQYDLLLPRDPDKALLVVPANIDSFAGEWDLPLADIRMWVLVHELAAHAVLSTPHLRAALIDAVNSYVSAFSPTPMRSSRSCRERRSTHPTRWRRSNRRCPTRHCCSVQ